jgi:Type III restriction enzyme, res subunit
MTQTFFEKPILNSPYGHPKQHWELDESGQPTNHITPNRRKAEFITPIPKPKKQKREQKDLVFNEGKGLSTEQQQYELTSAFINELRVHVDRWRALPNPNQWNVTPETARLLQHWRQYPFTDIRPFFCQIEAVETAIWLTEVAPKIGKEGRRFLDHITNANADSNPLLWRVALKLATGSGKTTVMAMLIAWQTVNAVRRPNSKNFTRGFLIVTPGLTIKDRLRVRTRASAPTSRTTASDSKSHTATPRRCAATVPTSSSSLMTATDRTTPCTSSSRSRAIAAKTPKEKKSTMDTYWIPGVNHLGTHGRWAFAEFTDVWDMQLDFAKKVETEFNRMIDSVAAAVAS